VNTQKPLKTFILYTRKGSGMGKCEFCLSVFQTTIAHLFLLARNGFVLYKGFFHGPPALMFSKRWVYCYVILCRFDLDKRLFVMFFFPWMCTHKSYTLVKSCSSYSFVYCKLHNHLQLGSNSLSDSTELVQVHFFSFTVVRTVCC